MTDGARDGAVVLTERRGAVQLVTLHRPDRLTARVPASEAAHPAALADADLDAVAAGLVAVIPSEESA